MAREFDLVLLGATGFTGRLVAQYLALAAPPGTRIALAGRNQARLQDVRRSLPAAAHAWPVLLADSTSQSDLTTLAPRTTVVCTTVGPYAKLGLPLVAACAQAGTHTCDLSGEVHFMRDCIDRFDAAARLSGARIVHSCGFDSIPSDLGVHLLHERLGPMTRATLVIEELKGGFSGGTVASLLNGLEEAFANPARRKLLSDPYALSPDRPNEPVLQGEGDLMGFRRDAFVGRWVAPFVMASVNTRVVRRSNALRGWQYGRQFRYAEVTGMKGPLSAAGLTLGLGAFMGLLAVPLTRTLVAPRLPQPGEGPSPALREHGRLRLRILGEAESGQRAAVVVSGRGDPGYALTSVMLGEAALCLALDAQALPARAGVLTPATAMGGVLVERLRLAGLTFAIEEGR